MGEEAKGHALQVDIHLLSQIKDDPLPDSRTQVALSYADKAAHEWDGNHAKSQQIQAGGVATRQDIVDQVADQEWWHQTQ